MALGLNLPLLLMRPLTFNTEDKVHNQLEGHTQRKPQWTSGDVTQPWTYNNTQYMLMYNNIRCCVSQCHSTSLQCSRRCTGTDRWCGRTGLRYDTCTPGSSWCRKTRTDTAVHRPDPEEEEGPPRLSNISMNEETRLNQFLMFLVD